VVVFSGDRRNRGYLVKSRAEELRIRAFLKMFYFAHCSILVLGMLVANAWSTFLINIHAFGSSDARVAGSAGIYVGIYSVVVGVPYLLLWRTYKKSLLSYVSAQDQVSVSGSSARRQPWTLIAALIAFGALILCGVILFLVAAKR
jgi:hypothetical protein